MPWQRQLQGLYRPKQSPSPDHQGPARACSYDGGCGEIYSATACTYGQFIYNLQLEYNIALPTREYVVSHY